MRIIAGKYKGKTIASPENGITHPMGERERNALFNMIGEDIVEASVLDAYAGTGALGLEAISRGARRALLVEQNQEALYVMGLNLKAIYPDEEVLLGLGDVETYARSADEEFDIVIADPPYDDFHPDAILALSRIVAPGGIFALSHPGDPLELPGFSLRKTRKYAGARISIYDKDEDWIS